MPGSSISSTQAPPGAPQVPEGAAGSSGWRGLGRRLKAAVRQLKQDVLALHYALQDPRVGWLPRILGFLAIAYALSPLDLIPDFIPVLGLLDDLVLLPGLLLLAMWLIPVGVMETAKHRAATEPLRLHKNIGMAIFIFVLWDASLLWLAWLACGASWAPPSLHDHRVLVVGGCSAALVGAEVAWAVGQWRQERAKAAAAADGLAAALLDP